MTRHRTFRVLATKSETYFVDLAARDEATALARAEKLWDGGMRTRFHRVMECAPVTFDIDPHSTAQLGDIANEDRARWALTALCAFAEKAGSAADGEALRDLLIDLGHYADQHGIDFIEEVDRASDIWAQEKLEGLQS